MANPERFGAGEWNVAPYPTADGLPEVFEIETYFKTIDPVTVPDELVRPEFMPLVRVYREAYDPSPLQRAHARHNAMAAVVGHVVGDREWDAAAYTSFSSRQFRECNLAWEWSGSYAGARCFAAASTCPQGSALYVVENYEGREVHPSYLLDERGRPADGRLWFARLYEVYPRRPARPASAHEPPRAIVVTEKLQKALRACERYRWSPGPVEAGRAA